MATMRIRVFNIDERCVGDILVQTFQDSIRDAFTASIFDIIRFLHFSLVVLVEHIGVQNQYGKCDEIGLVWCIELALLTSKGDGWGKGKP